MQVDVALAPPSEPPTGLTCLVVDVLRATSVMAVLLGRGVEAVFPAATVEQGRALRDQVVREGGARPLLCGEVGALPPEGYDYGNSPREFAALDALPGAAVVATSNGTPALLACSAAPLTLAAAPLNAAAATGAALAAGRDVLVVCAGPAGRCDDDVLAAGLLAERLAEYGAHPTDAACEAIERFQAVRSDFAAALRATPHGQTLVGLGFDEDIDFCAQVDRYDRAGALHLEGGRTVIRAMSATGNATGSTTGGITGRGKPE